MEVHRRENYPPISIPSDRAAQQSNPDYPLSAKFRKHAEAKFRSSRARSIGETENSKEGEAKKTPLLGEAASDPSLRGKPKGRPSKPCSQMWADATSIQTSTRRETTLVSHVDSTIFLMNFRHPELLPSAEEHAGRQRGQRSTLVRLLDAPKV